MTGKGKREGASKYARKEGGGEPGANEEGRECCVKLL